MKYDLDDLLTRSFAAKETMSPEFAQSVVEKMQAHSAEPRRNTRGIIVAAGIGVVLVSGAALLFWKGGANPQADPGEAMLAETTQTPDSSQETEEPDRVPGENGTGEDPEGQRNDTTDEERDNEGQAKDTAGEERNPEGQAKDTAGEERNPEGQAKDTAGEERNTEGQTNDSTQKQANGTAQGDRKTGTSANKVQAGKPGLQEEQNQTEQSQNGKEDEKGTAEPSVQNPAATAPPSDEEPEKKPSVENTPAPVVPAGSYLTMCSMKSATTKESDLSPSPNPSEGGGLDVETGSANMVLNQLFSEDVLGEQKITTYAQLQELIGETKQKNWGYNPYYKEWVIQWMEEQFAGYDEAFFEENALYMHTIEMTYGYRFELSGVDVRQTEDGKEHLDIRLGAYWTAGPDELVPTIMCFYSFLIQIPKPVAEACSSTGYTVERQVSK